MSELFWVDQAARKVVDAEERLKRTNIYRTEMGLGASGIPHVGSTGDGIRSYAVYLALKSMGHKAEFIAYSDDRDGLRKVPAGFPEEMEQEIGKPVSEIKDPFGCHDSLGLHVSSLLLEAFERLGVTFTLRRAHEEYAKGTLDDEITTILKNARKAAEIIKETTGQDKYFTQLPYLPICKECGRIYTTKAISFDEHAKKIKYKCSESFLGKNSNNGKEIEIRGCGYDGECGIREGKLAWKVEFAARWHALKINYEAYGKDILDSMRCNDRVCSEILGWEPPVHSFYELFTERSGRKISKSAGNVFTPATWMKYASPESLRLLFLKRLGTSRVVDPDAIPSYMDEVDALQDVYFGKTPVKNETDLARMRRLFEYVHFLRAPKAPTTAVQYNMLATILNIAKNKDVAIDILKRTGHLPEEVSAESKHEIMHRLEYVENWIKDTEKEEKAALELSDGQKKALHSLANELRAKKFDEETLYARLYEMAKEHELTPQQFFEGAYLTLLQNKRGPRLAQFIIAIGQKKAADIIEEAMHQ